MCLITLTAESRNIPYKFFQQVYQYNKQGWGIAWTDKKKVTVHKGFTLATLYNTYKELDNKGITDIAIHMRMATHGEVSEAMSHPFKCHESGIWLMHNGVTTYPGYQVGRDDPRSDTCLFAERFVSRLLKKVEDPSAFIRTAEFATMLANEGRGFFALYDKKGSLYYNSDRWSTTNFGAIVSNTGYFGTEFLTEEDRKTIPDDGYGWCA